MLCLAVFEQDILNILIFVNTLVFKLIEVINHAQLLFNFKKILCFFFFITV